MNREKLRHEIHKLYRTEHEALGKDGTLRLLEEARQWDLSGTLAAGGVVVFPHAGVAECGRQIAAAVHACLDSGADKVVVISVLHTFTDEMEAARVAVANGADPANWKFWGIQGDGLSGRIRDLTYSDATQLYNAPPPTWVATALFEWQLAGDR